MTESSQSPPPPAVPHAPHEPSINFNLLLTYLQHNDAICPVCRYNLRNLTQPRCPECGREIRIAIGVTEPFLLPWILTTVFVALAAGVGLIICIIFGVIVYHEGPPRATDIPFRAVPYLLAAAYTVLSLPLLALLVVLRRSFWRLQRQVQILLAIMAIGADAACLGFLIAAMFIF